MPTQSIQNPNTIVDVEAFTRKIAGMTITELHATYEGLVAAAEPISDVSYQSRCEDEDGNFNAAGQLLDRFAYQIHKCLEVLVEKIETLTPQTASEKNQKVHTVLHYGVLCFCDLDDIEELVERLKPDCGFAAPKAKAKAEQREAA